MASHEGSRKRIKISRTESKPSPSNMASSSTAVSSGECGSAGGSACNHGQSLTALQTDIEAMRQIVTCKICHRLLYEPYSLACGHTYCYSCLSQWLVDSRKKTCPDCRAVVYQQPTPSYLVRELVLVFVSRNELLPDGETVEEHNNLVKEEADLVAKDKASTDERTGGLFKGCFKRGARFNLGALHDPSDGVYRCPTCQWELEDGFCNNCGEVVEPHEHFGFSDYDDDSLSDDDLDHELDAEDALAVFGADGQDDYFDHESIDESLDPEPYSDDHGVVPQVEIYQPRRGLANRAHPHARGDRVQIDILSSGDEESEEDDDEEEDIPGFVVDDNNIEYESSDDGECTDVPRTYRNSALRHVVVVSDDDEPQPAAFAEATSESYDDSEDEGPVSYGSQRRKEASQGGRLQRNRRLVASDDESSEEEEEYESAIEERGGFSPLDSNAADYPDSVQTGYESDDVSTVHPMDDEDGNDAHVYHDSVDDDEHEDGESDDYDSESGWGIDPGTPEPPRQRPSTSSHRLHNLGNHSSRHTNSLAAAFDADRSPSLNGHYRPQFSVREPYSIRPASDRTYPLANPSSSNVAGSRQFGMFRPPPEHHRPRPENMLPAHPFQLGNTLNTLNSRASTMGHNYNQRNHHVRTNPAPRAVFATSSSRSSTTGGVNVYENNSNGSGSTIRPGHSSRRKRNLSISSDESLEDLRRTYAY